MKYSLRSLTPKRRWFQFSLKTLLVVITLICIGPGGYVAYEQRKAQKQMAAVEEIENVGGRVTFEGSSRSATMRWILGDDSFGSAVEVKFYGAVRVTDAHLPPLTELTNLRKLYIHDTQITDAGLADLRGLTKLEVLSLPAGDNSRVTQAGRDEIQKALPNCKIYGGFTTSDRKRRLSD